jgi:hypothetical protein
VEGEDSDTAAEVTLLKDFTYNFRQRDRVTIVVPNGYAFDGDHCRDRERLCTLGQGWKEHFPEDIGGSVQWLARRPRAGYYGSIQ